MNPINCKNLIEFIDCIKDYDTIENILELIEHDSEKGFVFERLWDIMLKFNCCDIFPKSKYINLIGNANKGQLTELKSLKSYLEKENVISGKKTGCGDISLKNIKTKKYILMSCKYINEDSSIDKYDIEKLVSLIDDKKYVYDDAIIYLLVKNKQSLLDKKKSSDGSSKYITKYIMNDNVLDLIDLNKYFKLWKKQIQKYDIDNYDDIYCGKKELLNLRFHQEMITEKTMDLINEGEKLFLYGCKPRSGKTFMIGGLIYKFSHNRKNTNTLVITPAPTETSPQFTKDLFKKYDEFKNFKIINIRNSKMKDIELGKNNIIIVSKQLLQNYIGKDRLFQKINIDLLIFDENHYGGTTKISKEIITSYTTKKTIKIFLTATYTKPLSEWKISDRCVMKWDIEDELLCKNNDIKQLQEKHGEEYVNNALKMTTLDVYNIYPELFYLTTLFDNNRYEQIREEIKDTNYGFSMETLFSLNKKKNQFNYEVEVKKILRYISGSNKIKDFPKKDKSFFGRIINTCTENNSRTLLDNEHFTTQLWFLPFGENLPIDKVSECLKDAMIIDPILNKFEIMIINSKIGYKVPDLKEEIRITEEKSKAEGKNGLILLAGNQCSLGITLPLVDIVMLLNNSLSVDKIYQMMYRSMTEAKNKKYGFVVDLNPSRILNTLIEYDVYDKNKSIEKKIEYLINYHLIRIDDDLIDSKHITNKTIIDKLINVWKDDPINNFRILLRHLENLIIELCPEDQKIVNELFDASTKKEKIKLEIEMNDDVKKIQLGIEKERMIDIDTKKADEKEKEEKMIQIIITKDVLPFIVPLVCILTMDKDCNDFMEMIKMIKIDKSLLDIFNEQAFVWWNHKDIINIIEKIVEKYVRHDDVIYNMALNIKLQLKSMIDSPDKLLELIDMCLKPKQIEKKKFGEVFTPMKLVNEMLDKLPEKVWTMKKYKWFDPANGMGNFPIAIYLRLMKGLEEKIPDDHERKKHILEKMLYVSELNKKNCFVYKLIMDINNEYKLNMYNGDSLKLNIEKEFGISLFDIVIGNPPYNKELTRVGALPLYNEFIEKYIDGCKYLMFIVPSRWFAGGKGLDKFRKFMLKRRDLVFIKHFDNAQQLFGSTVDIKGGVNYFLKDKQYSGDCLYNDVMIDLSKYDVLVHADFYGLIDKLIIYDNINKSYISQDHYKLQTNDSRLVENESKKTIKVYVSQQKGFVKYINKKLVEKDCSTYKIITARAAHKGNSGFGAIFIGKPNEAHTKSYISFNVGNEEEANSLLSYMKCKLPNLMLSLRKISQDISESTCKWIPLPPLDRIWTNKKVHKYFKLNDDEIKLVKNTTVVGYKDE